MVFKNRCVFVNWTKVALSLEGLKSRRYLGCMQCCWWLLWPIQNDAIVLKNYWNLFIFETFYFIFFDAKHLGLYTNTTLYHVNIYGKWYCKVRLQTIHIYSKVLSVVQVFCVNSPSSNKNTFFIFHLKAILSIVVHKSNICFNWSKGWFGFSYLGSENTVFLYWNLGKWVLIWEYSVSAFQWITKWQSLNNLCVPVALGENCLSIGRVNYSRVSVWRSGDNTHKDLEAMYYT